MLLIIVSVKVTTTSHKILLILGIFILSLIRFALVYNTAKKDLSSNNQYQKPDNQNSEAMSSTAQN